MQWKKSKTGKQSSFPSWRGDSPPQCPGIQPTTSPPPLAYKWQQQNCKVSRWFSLIVKVCRYQNNWSASLFDKSTFNSFVIVWLKYHITNTIRLYSHCTAWPKPSTSLPRQHRPAYEIRPPALTFRSFLFWSKTLLLWPQYSVRDINSDNM